MTAPQTTEDTVSLSESDAAARAVVQRLHDEAMQLIAELAENWDVPSTTAPAEEISVLLPSQLPPLLRSATALAAAETDQIPVQATADVGTPLAAAA